MGVKAQTIYITLENGKTGSFTGPALADKEPFKIVSVSISRPFDIPDGVCFETIDTEPHKKSQTNTDLEFS